MLTDGLTITITMRLLGRSVRIAVAGELDMPNVSWLEGTLDVAVAVDPAAVELDLGALTFFSCEGPNVLIQARTHVGDAFTLVAASPPVRRLITAMNMDQEFGLGDENPG